MPSIDDVADRGPDQGAVEEAGLEKQEEEVQQGPFGGLSFNLDFLKIETGTGDIGEYVNHPINFKKSEGLAQIIRGFSGLVGNAFNYWWIDVVMGAMRMRQEGSVKANEVQH